MNFLTLCTHMVLIVCCDGGVEFVGDEGGVDECNAGLFSVWNEICCVSIFPSMSAREGPRRQLYRPSNRGIYSAVSSAKCLDDGGIWNCKVILLENVARHWLRDQSNSLEAAKTFFFFTFVARDKS